MLDVKFGDDPLVAFCGAGDINYKWVLEPWKDIWLLVGGKEFRQLMNKVCSKFVIKLLEKFFYY